MGIQNWSENIILVELPQEPDMGEELELLIEIVSEKGNCDVVIDFSDVGMLTSSSLSKLLKLRKPITELGRRLVLCGVHAAIKGIFTVTGLDGVFEIADDKFMALATLEMIG